MPNSPTTHALTLGKFAPLHRGHQLVIETALAECDCVTVVIYHSPQATNVPLPVRAGWIRALYPAVNVIEGWDGPPDIGDDAATQRKQENYILNLLAGRQVTHFYSSETYGDHMSRALGAIDRRVDLDRGAEPISGTALREGLFENRHFVDPVVYRDLVTHVVFLGAPSTGKSTLTEWMARELGTCHLPEYGREYWDAHQIDRRLTPEQLVELAEGQIEREYSLIIDANGYLFVDTNALTTRQFALDYHGSCLPRLDELAEACAARYDLVFLCDDDIPYDDTWDRSGEVHRATFQAKIRADLLMRRIPFVTLRGDLDSRVQQVKRVLAGYRKWESLPDTVLGMDAAR